MKRLLINTFLGLVCLSIGFFPKEAKAYYQEQDAYLSASYSEQEAEPSIAYQEAWEFVCEWDCGEASFESEYGGYTLHGYSSSFYDEFPDSEAEAAEWAYYDYWLPAGCSAFSTSFSQTVCLDTAFFHGVGAWQQFSNLYWENSDDVLACKVIEERAAARDPNAPYAEGWRNRDRALAELGNCSATLDGCSAAADGCS